MNVDIIEKFKQGKQKNPNFCEDRIILTENFYCVVDGATSKSNFEYESKSTGKLAGEIIDLAVKKADREFSHLQFFDYLTDCLRIFYKDNGLLNQMENSPVDRFSATVCVYSMYHDEVWIVGDCQSLVDNLYYSNSNYIELINAEMRAIIIQLALSEGRTIAELQEKDTGREFILPVLERQYVFQNAFSDNKLSYAVVDGFKIDSKKIVKVDTSNSKEIVLASDGYPKLFSTLLESERYLQKVLELDPLCYSLFKSTKGLYNGNRSFDDRAYLKIIKTD